MSWGRGWEVGVRKAIHAQQKAEEQAARILAKECGTKHAHETRSDICPSCKLLPGEYISALPRSPRRRAT